MGATLTWWSLMWKNGLNRKRLQLTLRAGSPNASFARSTSGTRPGVLFDPVHGHTWMHACLYINIWHKNVGVHWLHLYLDTCRKWSRTPLNGPGKTTSSSSTPFRVVSLSTFACYIFLASGLDRFFAGPSWALGANNGRLQARWDTDCYACEPWPAFFKHACVHAWSRL